MSSSSALRPRLLRRLAAPAALLVLLALALWLRTCNVNWDLGHYFHPDERQILMVASALSWPRDLRLLLSPASPLNPHFFAYGSFPIYLLRLLVMLVGQSGWDWALGSNYTQLGRLLSACFDTASVLAVYLLARKVYGRRVGLLAALLLAFTVLHIQLAHFYAVDTLLTLLLLLAVSKAVDVARHGRRRDGVCLGLLVGVALATKVSVLPLVVVALVAWFSFAWPADNNHGGTETLRDPSRRSSVISGLRGAVLELRAVWGKVRRSVLLTLGVAGLTFALLEPYALIDAYSFLAGMGTELAMAGGRYDFPYTRQYAGTWGYFYQIRQILLFAMGLPLGLLGIAGLLWLCWRVWKHSVREEMVLLTWPLLYTLMQGATYAKFIRYMLPLLPFLCLAGAALWVRVWDALVRQHASRGPRSAPAGEVRDGRVSAFRWLWLALLLVVVASTVFYAIAFLNIYRRPHPWMQASAWICAHVPPGSTILTEYWDDPLPLGGVAATGGCPLPYARLIMDFHTLDTGERLEELLDALQASDYIAISSQRLYGSLTRSPQYFPLATRYYRQLFAGLLGFRLVAAPTVYPQWLGVTLADNPRAGLGLPTPPLLAASRPSGLVLDLGQADESFTVYDHPQPLIFARVQRLSREELRSLIALQATGER